MACRIARCCCCSTVLLLRKRASPPRHRKRKTKSSAHSKVGALVRAAQCRATRAPAIPAKVERQHRHARREARDRLHHVDATVPGQLPVRMRHNHTRARTPAAGRSQQLAFEHHGAGALAEPHARRCRPSSTRRHLPPKTLVRSAAAAAAATPPYSLPTFKGGRLGLLHWEALGAEPITCGTEPWQARLRSLRLLRSCCSWSSCTPSTRSSSASLPPPPPHCRSRPRGARAGGGGGRRS